MAVFSPVGSSTVTIPAISVTGATTPTLTTVDLTLAATEYSYALPANVKQFLIKLRGLDNLHVGYISGSTFLTVPRACFYSESQLTASGITLYFSSDLPGQTAEILTWV